MKERPLLFNGEMVRAILEGRKSQTRRIGKYQKDDATELGVEYMWHATKGKVAVADYRAFPNKGTARWGLCECPYGVPGDRLWVKETFCPQVSFFGQDTDRTPFYRAFSPDLPIGHKWRPSIFMPRWASRIDLEITKVRVERVQDITEMDAIAEGIETDGTMFKDYSPEGAGFFTQTAMSSYCGLWESINGIKSWQLNSWVWVIEFRRVKP